jgi:hypothetical protein
LESVVKFNRTRDIQVQQTREDREGLLNDVLHNRTRKMSASVGPGLDHQAVEVDNFLKTEKDVLWVVHMKRLISAVADDHFV